MENKNKNTSKLEKLRNFAMTPLPQGLSQKLPRKGDIEYISGTTIIDILNHVFNNSWSVEYSAPIYEPFSGTDSPPVVTIKATLSVWTTDPETGEVIKIVREGYGSDTLNVKNPNGREMVTKSASTDALKRAAYTFGIALELKRKKNAVENDFFNTLNSPWNAYTSSLYHKELNTINTISKAYNIPYDVIKCIAREYFKDENCDITPSNIVEFTQHLTGLYKLSTDGNAAKIK